MTTTKFYRHPGEGAARPEKEKGTTPFEIAPGNDASNSTVERSRETERERGLFLPLLWAELAREVKPAKFRGKTKRYQGAVDSALVGLLALALVSGVLLLGGA